MLGVWGITGYLGHKSTICESNILMSSIENFGDTKAYRYTGGITGILSINSTMSTIIRNCTVYVDVVFVDTLSLSYSGGIVGYSTNSYSTLKLYENIINRWSPAEDISTNTVRSSYHDIMLCGKYPNVTSSTFDNYYNQNGSGDNILSSLNVSSPYLEPFAGGEEKGTM